ncbi:MAG: T9SS type A sorting domain-containing protein [Cytophagales bacterium]|nr:T9SS type A sorting domain-containing protein [Cytophagales bacterium]
MSTHSIVKINNLNTGILVFAIWCIVSISSFAQTTSTTTNPDWTSDSDWTGTAPDYDMNQSAILAHNSTITDPLIINNGLTLTINSGVTLTTNEVITIKEGGTLIVNGTITGTDSGKEFKIEKGTFTVNSGGALNWAGYWTSDDNPATITINGLVSIDGDMSNKVTISGSGNIEVGGTLNNDGGSIFGCTDSGADCCAGSGCLLPIELISFYGVPVRNGIDIYWSTASEINNDFFTIERSSNGIQWEIIHETKGAGNSSIVLKYSYTDSNPPIGTVYYRLKQTDYDGTFSYSDIIVVNSFLTKDAINSYPNPAFDSFTLKSGNIQNLEVLIFNSFGQQFDLPVKRYFNKIEFDITSLKSGIYFVNVRNHSLAYKTNFIKIP